MGTDRSKPKRIFPTKQDVMRRPEYFRYKRLNYRGIKMTFARDIRKGICSFCKKSVRLGEIKMTALHHIQYDDLEPLAWTVEVCTICHYKLHHPDKHIRKKYSAIMPPKKTTKLSIKEIKMEKAYSYEEIRKKYPNAYAKWTKSDDLLLKNFWLSSSQSKKEKMRGLMNYFGRHRGAIVSRLNKLGLV
ncbi:MAG: hypothetical protein O6746_02955 [Thaumarchaeota archaeon]|nr:hypothetical protein [Nitrososphaerota archaeon]